MHSNNCKEGNNYAKQHWHTDKRRTQTKKNEPVKTLYDRLGFDCINDWNIGKEYQIKIDDIKMDDIPYANITGI